MYWEYNLSYTVSNVFDALILYKCMGIFFDRSKVDRKIEILSYIVYCIVLTMFTLFMNILIVILLFNIIAFTALTYNYKASFKRRFLSVILMYVCLVFLEAIGVYLAGYSSSVFEQSDYIALETMIITKSISYIIVFIVTKFGDIKIKTDIPTTYWIYICLIPFASILCLIALIESKSDLWVIVSCVILLLIINFSVLNLYNVITKAYSERITHILLSRQNMYFINQFELIKTSIKAQNAQKHDLKNHLSVIESLVRRNEIERASQHIEMVMNVCLSPNEIAHSGNIVIDSILNYKLWEAEQQGIIVCLESVIPEKLDISSYDMTIILGNILDNAINAAKKLEENRRIDLKIKYNKGRLLIKLDNKFDGEVVYENGTLVTSNKSRDNHGIGLQNVQSVIEKYDGKIKIKHTDDIFSVMLIMFV